MRSKAAEDILHALPSKRNDLLVVSEHKTFHNSIVPGGGSTVDKMHLSKSVPEKEHVGLSTIHDFKGKFYLSRSMSSCNWFKSVKNQECNSLNHRMSNFSDMILCSI